MAKEICNFLPLIIGHQFKIQQRYNDQTAGHRSAIIQFWWNSEFFVFRLVFLGANLYWVWKYGSSDSKILCSGGGVTKPIFPVPFFFHFFQNFQNTLYLYIITFIFDMCHCSWAAETPDKYERDLKYPTYTFGESNFGVTENMTNGALLTPTQGGRNWLK